MAFLIKNIELVACISAIWYSLARRQIRCVPRQHACSTNQGLLRDRILIQHTRDEAHSETPGLLRKAMDHGKSALGSNYLTTA